MDILEKVKKCDQQNCKIDMEKFPPIYIAHKCQLKGEKYYKYHDIRTGKVIQLKLPDNCLVTDPGNYSSTQGLVYIKFYDQYKLLEMSIVEFNSKRNKEGGIRPLHFATNRVFLDPATLNAYVHDNGTVKLYQNYYLPIPYYDHHSIMNRHPHNFQQYNDALAKFQWKFTPQNLKEVEKFYTIAKLEKPKDFRVNSIVQSIKEVQRKPTNQVTQAKNAKLLSLLQNYTEQELKALQAQYTPRQFIIDPDKKKDDRYNYYSYRLVGEKLTDEIGVIRAFTTGVDFKWCYRDHPYKGYYEFDPHLPTEAYRLYITPKEVIEFKNLNRYSYNHEYREPSWERTTYINLGRYGGAHCYVDNLENLLNCQQRVKYLAPLIKDEIDTHHGLFVYSLIAHCLRHPMLEQLSKAGYKAIAKRILENGQINAALKDMFGDSKYDSKTLNIYQKIGINKEQLKFIEEQIAQVKDAKHPHCADWYTIISAMHNTWGKDLASLSLKDFINLANKTTIIKQYCWYWYDGTPNWALLCPQQMREDEEACYKYINRILNIVMKADKDKTDWPTMEAYRDGLRMYHSVLNTEFQYNYDFNLMQGSSDIVRFHDACQAMDQMRIVEQRRLRAMAEDERNKELEKKMGKLNKERAEAFPYEDDTYTIQVPEHLSDITTEGAVLHHCVGGYVQRHAQGDTTILFLRKKNYPTNSFYTIEVANDKHVVQIHGVNNQWLGCNPEVIPFVKRWLRDKGILCNKQIYLCNSKSYDTYGSQMVDDPEI